MKDRKILVAVDLQNDFIDGALGTKEHPGDRRLAAESGHPGSAGGLYPGGENHFRQHPPAGTDPGKDRGLKRRDN